MKLVGGSVSAIRDLGQRTIARVSVVHKNEAAGTRSVKHSHPFPRTGSTTTGAELGAGLIAGRNSVTARLKCSITALPRSITALPRSITALPRSITVLLPVLHGAGAVRHVLVEAAVVVATTGVKQI